MRRAAAASSPGGLPLASPVSKQIFGVSLPSNRERSAAMTGVARADARDTAGSASAAPAAFRMVRRDGPLRTDYLLVFVVPPA